MPYLVALIIGCIYPNVLDIIGYISLLINNFNGFIIPTLLRIEIYKRELVKKWFKILLNYTYIFILIGCAIIGIVNKAFSSNKSENK